MKRGSIELARRLCYEIAGPTDEDDIDGRGYSSVDIAEILSAEVERLQRLVAEMGVERLNRLIDEIGRDGLLKIIEEAGDASNGRVS